MLAKLAKLCSSKAFSTVTNAYRMIIITPKCLYVYKEVCATNNCFKDFYILRVTAFISLKENINLRFHQVELIYKKEALLKLSTSVHGLLQKFDL